MLSAVLLPHSLIRSIFKSLWPMLFAYLMCGSTHWIVFVALVCSYSGWAWDDSTCPSVTQCTISRKRKLSSVQEMWGKFALSQFGIILHISITLISWEPHFCLGWVLLTLFSGLQKYSNLKHKIGGTFVSGLKFQSPFELKPTLLARVSQVSPFDTFLGLQEILTSELV